MEQETRTIELRADAEKASLELKKGRTIISYRSESHWKKQMFHDIEGSWILKSQIKNILEIIKIK